MKIKFTCIECGKVFYKYKSQKPKYCSLECKSKNQKKNKKENNPNWKDGISNTKIICKKCGEIFYGRYNRIYCSLSCKSKDQDHSHIKKIRKDGKNNPNWKGNLLNKICPNCKKEFRAKRQTQTYCCKECFKKSLSINCKNGHASYMNSKIINPSKPQIELYDLIKSIYNDSILNFPTKSNFSIDIAIPSLFIAIEYDGSYWHDEKKDKIRQKIIEKEGWKFIRYKDYIPSIKELKKDINERKR